MSFRRWIIKVKVVAHIFSKIIFIIFLANYLVIKSTNSGQFWAFSSILLFGALIPFSSWSLLSLLFLTKHQHSLLTTLDHHHHHLNLFISSCQNWATSPSPYRFLPQSRHAASFPLLTVTINWAEKGPTIIRILWVFTTTFTFFYLHCQQQSQQQGSSLSSPSVLLDRLQHHQKSFLAFSVDRQHRHSFSLFCSDHIRSWSSSASSSPVSLLFATTFLILLGRSTTAAISFIIFILVAVGGGCAAAEVTVAVESSLLCWASGCQRPYFFFFGLVTG